MKQDLHSIALMIPLLLLGVGSAGAQNSAPAPVDLATRLNSVKVTFKFLATPADACIAFLASESGFRIDILPDTSTETPITFAARDMPLARALRWIVFQAGLGMQVEADRVVVGNREILERLRVKLGVFDIRELTRSPPSTPCDDLLAFPFTGFANPIAALEDFEGMMFEEELIDLITSAVQPESWGNEQWSIEVRRGLLMVQSVPEVLAEIELLLTEIRGQAIRPLVVRTMVVSIPAESVTTLLGEATSGDLRTVYSAAESAALYSTLASSAGVESIGQYSTLCISGQPLTLGSRNDRTFQIDFDVEVAQGAAAIDPIQKLMPLGLQIAIDPVASADGKSITLRVEWQLAMNTSLRTAPYGDGRDVGGGAALALELPRIEFSEVRTTMRMEDGGAAVALIQDPETDTDAERVLALIVSVSIQKEVK